MKRYASQPGYPGVLPAPPLGIRQGRYRAFSSAARGTPGGECHGDLRPDRGIRLMAACGESPGWKSRIGLWREPALLAQADREVTSLSREWLRRSSEVVTRRAIDGDFVVSLIGMRLNHPLRIRTWRPVAAAMPKMLKVLSQHPELGCPAFHQRRWPAAPWRTPGSACGGRTSIPWTRFARTGLRLPAGSRGGVVQPRRRASGDVGIWHETFRVRAGEYEAVYGRHAGLRPGGSRHVLPAARKGNTAATRIGACTP